MKLALAAMLLAGCSTGSATSSPTSDSPPRCDFTWHDQLCQMPPGKCYEAGDGKCYQRCTIDDDCSNVSGTVCAQIGLYHGGDACGLADFRVCRPPSAPRCAF